MPPGYPKPMSSGLFQHKRPRRPPVTSLHDGLRSHLGWVAIGTDLQLRQLNVNFNDEPLLRMCGGLTAQLQLCRERGPLDHARYFKSQMNAPVWDMIASLYKLARSLGSSKAWTSVPGAQSDINHPGNPVSLATVDSSGQLHTPGADGVIAGFTPPSRAIALGKRLGFSNGEVQFQVNLDPSTAAHEFENIGAGEGVQVTGTTSRGTKVSVKVGIGRDQTGRRAGGFIVQIGPDDQPMASQYLPPSQP